MEISKLGEFGLIDHLTKDIKPKNETTCKGVGDDCAVMHFGDEETLVTTDMLMEGIHFDLTYVDMKHLGYKSAMVNISDIFAMGGTPCQIVVSIALSKRFGVEDMEAFYEGLRMACDKWNVDIVGGDTTSSMTGLAISITCIGKARKEDIIYRSGAKDTDLICVSGDLGGAYCGLQLLEREKTVFYKQIEELQKKMRSLQEKKNVTDDEDVKHGIDNKLLELNKQLEQVNFEPDFSGREYLLERQLQPEARGDIMKQLREANIHPTSMIDISDGLSSEIMHICKESNTGCRIFEKEIPIDYQTAVMAEEMNMSLTTCALNGGEDYELLFTVSIGDYERVKDMEGIRVIGHITRPELGYKLVTRDGQEFELQAQGYTHM